ncbi:MAG TPA: glycosyltransferase family 4 protein [Phycisphaerae bacterium]|nr:glycosyltransferase family 4 protein [Phycisphaerae bacterium]
MLPGFDVLTPPRHILFVTEFFHPDLCASAVVAADHLTKIAAARPDWRITVLTSQRAWNSPNTLYPLFEDWEGIKILRVRRSPVSRTSLIRRGWGFIEFGYQAVRAARALPQVDLVIGTTAPPQGGAIARRIAKQRRCPYIYEVLDLYPDCAAALRRIKPGGLIERAWRRFDRKVMLDAVGVVTISDPITRRLAQTRGIPGDCLLTIHDGFDPTRLAPFERNLFKETYNPGGRFVVQYAGNMGLSHPFESIVAAARLLIEDPGILMMFIGEGPQRAVIRAGLAADGLVLDYQPPESLSQILATADLCLISQHAHMYDKALPYKIYAILAAGRPAIFIGDARSEIAQWLTRYGAGIQIDQGQPEALVALIRELKNDSPRRKTMSRAARALFDQQFNSTRAAQSWIEAIESVLPDGTSQP